MKAGSLFSGIGGFDVGFERAGFSVEWCVENDASCQALLAGKFPSASLYGDIRTVSSKVLDDVDVIYGGFPCQDVSIAGYKKGLAGERSGLFHEAVRVVRDVNPRLVILENVPGLLCSNNGHDFAEVIRELATCWSGAEVGWRVLDSQHFGVPQRRRRVFIVAGPTRGCVESVLSFSDSIDRAAEESGHTRQATQASDSRGPGKCGPETHTEVIDRDALNGIVGCLTCHIPKQYAESVRVGHYIAINRNGQDEVRLLTPLECERLQGFPDNWTEGQSNTVRYKQLGNAVTVNVAEWLGRNAYAFLKEHHE